MRRREKNPWVLVLLLLVGVIIGGYVGELLGQFELLSFFSKGKPLGINLNKPFVLNLEVIKFSFALAFKVNLGSVIGMIISLVVYSKL